MRHVLMPYRLEEEVIYNLIHMPGGTVQGGPICRSREYLSFRRSLPPWFDITKESNVCPECLQGWLADRLVHGPVYVRSLEEIRQDAEMRQVEALEDEPLDLESIAAYERWFQTT